MVCFFLDRDCRALAQAQATARRKARSVEVSGCKHRFRHREKGQQPQAGSRGFPGPHEAGQGQGEAVGGGSSPRRLLCGVHGWVSVGVRNGRKEVFVFLNCTSKVHRTQVLPF